MKFYSITIENIDYEYFVIHELFHTMDREMAEYYFNMVVDSFDLSKVLGDYKGYNKGSRVNYNVYMMGDVDIYMVEKEMDSPQNNNGKVIHRFNVELDYDWFDNIDPISNIDEYLQKQFD